MLFGQGQARFANPTGTGQIQQPAARFLQQQTPDFGQLSLTAVSYSFCSLKMPTNRSSAEAKAWRRLSTGFHCRSPFPPKAPSHSRPLTAHLESATAVL